MKPIEIYALPATKTTTSLSQLDYVETNHLPEITESISKISHLNEKIVIHTIKEHSYDYDSSWCLYTVWFENTPVMILQEAGESNDHEERFITNEPKFIEMVQYIRSLLQTLEPSNIDVYDEEEDLPELTHFSGYRLNENTLQVERNSESDLWKLSVHHYSGLDFLSTEDKKEIYRVKKQFLFDEISTLIKTNKKIVNIYPFTYKKEEYTFEITETKQEKFITSNTSYLSLQQHFNKEVFEHIEQIFLSMNRMFNVHHVYKN